MTGRTFMGPFVLNHHHAIDVAFNSAYLLIGHKFSENDQLSGRLERFRGRDRTGLRLINNNEKGDALTFAYVHDLSPSLQIRSEASQIYSDRPARFNLMMAAQQRQTLFQLSLKWHD